MYPPDAVVVGFLYAIISELYNPDLEIADALLALGSDLCCL